MEVFVPGRLCLIGEHADWASFMADCKGYSIIATTNQGLYAQVSFIHRQSSTNTLQLTYISHLHPNTNVSYLFYSKELTAQGQAKQESFMKYVFGVLHILEEKYSSILKEILIYLESIHINQHKTDLPVKKGLSSSASICVLIPRVINRVYEDLYQRKCFTIEEEMEIAYLGERLTGSQCGRLDQTVAYGRATMLLLQYDKNQQITISPIMTPTNKLFFVIVDLLSSKDTVRILQGLQEAFLHYQEKDRKETSTIPLLYKNANNYLLEWNSQLVLEAKRSIEQGNAIQLGKLMNEAQVAFDANLMPLCTDQLSAPKLHYILKEILSNKDLNVLGGKCVGSGGDGTAQFICLDEASQRKTIQFIQEQYHLPCIALII